MLWIVIETFGLAGVLASIVFFSRRLPVIRRRRARKHAVIGTGVLAVVLGLSYAQMAPVRAWPTREYWTAGLFQDTGFPPYCSVRASEYPANTLNFVLIQGNFGTAVAILSTKQAHKIEASQISFASDGFDVLTGIDRANKPRAIELPRAMVRFDLEQQPGEGSLVSARAARCAENALSVGCASNPDSAEEARKQGTLDPL